MAWERWPVRVRHGPQKEIVGAKNATDIGGCVQALARKTANKLLINTILGLKKWINR